ncbi:hypothetical protein CFC21_099870 [Triticum aestivum]|uniref:BTB domain-containing protein n=2 Tax=Triticum aestivum TaxID=4565 RepID=A0A9R1M0C4_WHEAT|nr:BTB/POZ and MATH domain-containing protein 1-like [Triticum aestivum]KAF7098103.1 hypothetical protein CFC21_099870 [Triticum aestivum]
MATTCTVLTGAVRAVKLLKVDSFRLAYKTMREGEFLRTSWNVDGHDVEIRWYPGTAMAPVELVFLTKTASTCNVRASFGCLLVHPRLPQPHNGNEEKTVWHVFKHPKDCSLRVSLVDQTSRQGDYLTVQCTVTILKELAYTTTTVPAPASNMHQHFRELLRNGTGADVTFLVSGKAFAAHKLVLAARSPVFMAEFFGDMKEKSSRRVEIKDMEATVFGALLEFIYTDNVPELPSQKKKNVPELDRELEAVATMAQHLLAAADRYGIDRLKIMCEGKLIGGITVDTAATTLALAEQHNCPHLKEKCVEFIISTPAILDAVVATEGSKHLEASCPSALTSIVLSTRGRRN